MIVKLIKSLWAGVLATASGKDRHCELTADEFTSLGRDLMCKQCTIAECDYMVDDFGVEGCSGGQPIYTELRYAYELVHHALKRQTNRNNTFEEVGLYFHAYCLQLDNGQISV